MEVVVEEGGGGCGRAGRMVEWEGGWHCSRTFSLLLLLLLLLFFIFLFLSLAKLILRHSARPVCASRSRLTFGDGKQSGVRVRLGLE